jgi:hypothetical protein
MQPSKAQPPNVPTDLFDPLVDPYHFEGPESPEDSQGYSHGRPFRKTRTKNDPRL